MNNLTADDLQFCVTRLPKDVRDILVKYNLFVGGGFIRNSISGEKVNDIDLFGPDEVSLKLAAQELALGRRARIHETKYATTIICPPRLPVQFIKRWLYSDITTLCNEFDYTVCQAAIGSRDGAYYSECSRRYYSDLAAKRLVYTSPQRDEEAGGSFLRMRKFLKRGYTIQAASMAGVVARLVAKLDLTVGSIADEKWVKKVVTGLLHEVDPLVVVDGLEVIDEHERVEGEDE